MPLPSQTARPIARRTHMHRSTRRRRLAPRLVALTVLVAALLLVWKFWPGGANEPSPSLVTGVGTLDGAEAESALDTTLEADRDRVETASAPAPTPAIPAPEPEAPPPTANDAVAMRELPRTLRRPEPAPVREPAIDVEAPAESTPEPRLTAPSASPDRGARRARRQMETGFDLLARNDPVEGRRVLSQALLSDDLAPAQARQIRERLTLLNDRILFGPQVVPGDPFVFTYRLEPNEFLSGLPRKLGVQTDWRFIQHINRIPAANRVRSGQRLKVVTGPFHAVVVKSEYRLDLYLGEDEDRVYARSFQVGLGEFDSTPEGTFIVRPNSKLINPEWQNPRTGERFAPDDPMNPIGEYWLGLDAIDPHLADISGYGIHGTIDHDSIGQQASMGCVRLLPDDVKLVWFVLMPGVSRVEIVS